MCQLLGMNCNTPTDITFSFTGFAKRGGKTDHHSDGWGIAFFEGRGLRHYVDHLPAADSPVAELIRRYHDRIVYVHLKDFTPEPFAFLPLGKGDIDFGAILDELDSAGYGGWITIELDEFDGAPVDAARESRQYLQSVLARTVSQ